MTHENFGLHLKEIRRFKKLTQMQISKQLNISRQAYSNYEQGRCLPPPDTLANISVLLDTNLFILFIHDAFIQHNFKPLVQNSEIPEDELAYLLDLYSKMSLESRNILLEQIQLVIKKVR